MNLVTSPQLLEIAMMRGNYSSCVKSTKPNMISSGPCYDPDYCSRLVEECEYYCESPVENVVTCTYELTQLRYENRPGVPPPPVPLAGRCSDRYGAFLSFSTQIIFMFSHEVCSKNPCRGFMKEPECVDLC